MNVSFHEEIPPAKKVRHFLAALVVSAGINCAGADGYWSITQLSIRDALGPVINNNGEIVWSHGIDGGIYSSVRGQLTSSGSSPHLANSGEVVYRDQFESGLFDLVSTTRGRLTFGGMVDANSAFDLNSSGEVVYAKRDLTGTTQIYSTTRGQITFDFNYHYDPCINDHGEIIWGQTYSGLLLPRTTSNTRGLLPESYGFLPEDLNNHGEIIFQGVINGIGPHISSSVHGMVIDDADQYQWDGSINDAGIILWTAIDPANAGLFVYQSQWIVPEPSVLALLLVGGAAMSFRRPSRQ